MAHQDRLLMAQHGLRDNVALLTWLVPQREEQQQQRATSGGLLVGNTHILFNTARGDIKLGQLRTILSR
jgi:hypothetical protein